MRRIKKVLLTVIAMILVMPSFFVTASSNENESEEMSSHHDGIVASKDEVIYATLSPTGEKRKMYVVNTLDIEKAGKIVDYGFYKSSKNLTDTSKIEHKGDKIQFTAPAGKFFFQGDLEDQSLPWNIAISYSLDGKKVSPHNLAGKEGHVGIRIKTAINDQVNPIFAENYLLQITIPLDTSNFSNIQSDDGMVVNVGKNKQVTYTVMPEKEKEFRLEADVKHFELDGIDISAIPSTMAIEAPNTSEMTSDMKTLSESIAELNDAVGQLENGISELNNGTGDLQVGSKQFKNGIYALHDASSKLNEGSGDISKSLHMMSTSIGEAKNPDVSELKQLGNGLMEIANGLDESADGLTSLKGKYTTSFQVLDEALTAIPAIDISEEELIALYGSDADQEVIKKLIDSYRASFKAKMTYKEVRPVFSAVEETLTKIIPTLKNMAINLKTMAKGLNDSIENMKQLNQLEDLQEGLATLAANYRFFHSGIVDYTAGVGRLAQSYGDVHKGITTLSGGTDGLADGVGQLSDGTAELREETSDLPEQMNEEIEQMISDYDKSDFQAESFVSKKNENVNLVQFILKTESIKYEKTKENEESTHVKKGFWARLFDLFRK